MQELCDLLFEFSNEDRLRILKSLAEETANVTNLARSLDLTTQEASRHLSRLGDVGLTVKDPEGFYRITTFGSLALRQMSGIEFTSLHRDYFREHSLDDLPLRFTERIGELAGSRRIDDVMVVFHAIERIIDEADEYIYRLTDRYLMMAIPQLEEATARGVRFRLLRTKDFEFPPDWPGEGNVLVDARLKGTFKIKASDTANVFMAINEKEVAAIAFPLADGRYDYLGFSSTDPVVHAWCKGLYEHYWVTAKIPEALAD